RLAHISGNLIHFNLFRFRKIIFNPSEFPAFIELFPSLVFSQKYSGFLPFVFGIITVSVKINLSFVPLQKLPNQLLFHGSKSIKTTEHEPVFILISEGIYLISCRFMNHSGGSEIFGLQL